MSITSPPPGAYACTILNGASLSNAIPVYGKLVGIVIPQAWTAAGLTFQAATDQAGTFTDVWDSALTATAVERVVVSGNVPTTGGRFIALSLNDWLGIKFLKVRSGTQASPVNQGADRILVLVTCG